MFYETMTHKFKEVANAQAAAEILRSDEKPNSYECLTYIQEGKKIILVSDMDANGPSWFEIAVLEQRGEDFFQIESITNGWIKTTEALTKYFIDAVTHPCGMGKASLIIDKTKGTETAWFTCGCCGNYFKDNVQKQLKYDQDNGYGICSENGCNKYYD